MVKPFQFSIRWAAAGMAFFCVDAWLLARLCKETPAVHRLSVISAMAFGSITGAAIGCFFGKPLDGTIRGFIFGFILFFIWGIFTRRG
jgi:hypothetical protein